MIRPRGEEPRQANDLGVRLFRRDPTPQSAGSPYREDDPECNEHERESQPGPRLGLPGRQVVEVGRPKRQRRSALRRQAIEARGV